jgi:urease accessory protein UreF
VRAHHLPQISGKAFAAEWCNLNQRLSARRTSRESRDASLALGRRFLRLAAELLPALEPLHGHLEASETESHHVTAFGLVTALAGIGERNAVLAWLHNRSPPWYRRPNVWLRWYRLAPAAFFGR